MSEQIVLSGSLSVGPSTTTAGGVPSGTLGFTLATSPDPKPSGVQDKGSRQVATAANTYVSIGSVGAAQNVTQGDTLYLETDSPLTFRLTMANPAGADIVSVLPVQGTLFVEFPPANYLKLLEVTGTGACEYFISGAS